LKARQRQPKRAPASCTGHTAVGDSSIIYCTRRPQRRTVRPSVRSQEELISVLSRTVYLSLSSKTVFFTHDALQIAVCNSGDYFPVFFLVFVSSECMASCAYTSDPVPYGFRVLRSTCLSANVSQKPVFQTSPYFRCLLPVAVARFPSGSVASTFEDDVRHFSTMASSK